MLQWAWADDLTLEHRPLNFMTQEENCGALNKNFEENVKVFKEKDAVATAMN